LRHRAVSLRQHGFLVFTSVAIEDDGTPHCYTSEVTVDATDAILLSAALLTIKEAVYKIKSNSSPAPGGFPVLLVKNLASALI